MRIAPRLLLWSNLLCLPFYTHANTVQRCEDPTGKITFTTLGCPVGHTSQLQEAFNAPPGSITPLLPSADRRSTQASKEIVVVGQQEDGCGNRLSPAQRRQAIINQRTPPGMTKRDVESLLGRPDKITNRNGELRYTYNLKKGRSNSVTFDENGCVKGKR
ncbi:outer membrane protein assembly factor BamE [Pseudomonas cichorii]|nr:outer membrane protein assembly factor BamE [Pseudomonas cichorii]MBX8537054.1 outer membrane protein assembly factor BamE [Pseudomonas cichorii]